MASFQGRRESDANRIDKSHQLPSLRVLIYRGEKVVGIEELPDPRVAYVAAFDRQAKEFGLTARAG